MPQPTLQNGVFQPTFSGPEEKKVEQPKQLVLFFDVNDTVFLGDSAKLIGKEDAIQKLLSEQDELSYVWDSSISQEAMTFRKFVDKFLCPDDGDATKKDALRKARDSQYTHFVSFLEKNQHPRYAQIRAHYDALMDLFKDGYVMPSFIELVKHLQQSQTPFTIVFRTFGKDIKKVEEELERKTGLKLGYKANFKAGCLNLADGRTLASPQDMLQHIKPFEHACWQDNYDDWRATGEQCEGGKPFPIDFSDTTKKFVFLDDNIKKNILCVRPTVADSRDQKTMQADLMRSGEIVSVDTFKASTDVNYFMEKLGLVKQIAAENVVTTSVKKPKLSVYTEQAVLFDSVPSPVRMHGIFPFTVAEDDSSAKQDATLVL